MITGEESFLLYDTYGFPFDLTALIASERAITIDQKALKAVWKSRKSGPDLHKKKLSPPPKNNSISKTRFEGFDLDTDTLEAKVIDVQK